MASVPQLATLVPFSHKVAQSGFESLGLKYKKPAERPTLCILGAPARTRTWDDCSEDSNDIHFTTGAFKP